MLPVHLHSLTKRFGRTVAVDNVTLDIGPGELFFLLGPSGCGKTTVLRCIAGFYRADSGEIRFGDGLMTEVPPYRRNAGMVFQNYALWPHLKVWQNVAYGLRVRKVREPELSRRVDEILATVHMLDWRDRYPNQLSGGQQQRVALARALVIRPDVLLLDEPLSNLDAKLRLEMRREIRRLQREAGVTTIYVTHDQAEALSVADRMAIMREGKVEQIGTPREVYYHPASQFVADFIGETNLLRGTAVEVGGEQSTVEVASLRFQAPSPLFPLAPGQEVLCSLRPEVLKPGPGPSGFQAVVQSSTYLGSQEQYVLSLPDGQQVRMTVVNPGREGFVVGRTVTVQFASEDLVLLEASDDKRGG